MLLLREKYWKEHLDVVFPQELVLGHSEKGTKECAHYVPIPDMIRTYVSHADIAEEVNKPFQSNDDVLTDVADGSLLKEHHRKFHAKSTRGKKRLY